MSYLYQEEPMDTDGNDLYRSAEELEKIADGAKLFSSQDPKQLQDTSSDRRPMGGANPSAPPDTARVTIRVECAETLPNRWKILLEMALQSWSNTTLFKQTRQRCDFGRIRSSPVPDLAEVEISPSKAFDVLKEMKKADLFLKGFKTATTVHFLDQKGLPMTEDLYRSPEELEKNADGPKLFSSLDPKQLQDASGDGGSTGGAKPSTPPDTATVTIRVECAEPLPGRWRILLEKALQIWSNTTLFKQVGESCNIGSIQSLTGQDLAEVEISPSKALDTLKKIQKAELSLKGFKPITTVHFLVDGADPGKELHNSGPTVEQNRPSMPEVDMFFTAVVDLDKYSAKVQTELIQKFGSLLTGKKMILSGSFDTINKYYREVCDIVGGSRASLMRNDPNGAAMPPKTDQSETPPVLAVPLSHYWYFSRAYQKELSQFEKEFGVKINAEVSVSLSAVDENSNHKLPEVTQRFADFYQQSTCNLDSVQIPPTQLESEIVKQAVHSIQTDQVKMTLDMSAGECLRVGPKNYTSKIKKEMDLEYGMELARSSNGGMASEMETISWGASRNWSSPKPRSLEMDIRDPEGPIVMTETHWELMKTTSQQIHDIEQKYGVKFSAKSSQGSTVVTAQSVGTQPVNLKSHALRAFMHLHQKVAMSAVACTLKASVDGKTVVQALETLGFQDCVVQVQEKDGTRKLVGLPKHLGPAVYEIENLVGKPVFEDKSKQLTGYQQLCRNRSRLQEVDTSKGASWTHSNSGGPNKDPRQATAGGARGKGSDEDKDDNCPICMDKFTNKKKLRCGHEFCRECLETAMKTMGEKCPVCMEIFGKLIGNQPEGKMTHRQSPLCLPGYPHCGSIEIEYDIPDGVQTDKHPNPGRRYFSTHRRAYLPDNDEGRHVLKLLQRAFEQKLIFTVGTSTTTGAENSVIWNDIHHKTSTHGGPQSYGYPDPDYLRRVKEELKSKGIE